MKCCFCAGLGTFADAAGKKEMCGGCMGTGEDADADVDVKGRAHSLYTDADKAPPDVICDGNGQVVLDLCKVCGKAEVELLDYPECPGDRGVKGS